MRHFLCWKSKGMINGFEISLGRGIAEVEVNYETTFLRMRVIDKVMAYSRDTLENFFQKKVKVVSPLNYEDKLELIPNSSRLWGWDWKRVDECRFLNMNDPKFPPQKYIDYFFIFDLDKDNFLIKDAGETLFKISLEKDPETINKIIQMRREDIISVLNLYFKQCVELYYCNQLGETVNQAQNPQTSLDVSLPALTVKISQSLFFNYKELRLSIESQLEKIGGDFGDASVRSEQ